jgi:hypothetical protein
MTAPNQDMPQHVPYAPGKGKGNKDSAQPENICPENIFLIYPGKAARIIESRKGQNDHEERPVEIKDINGEKK